MSSRRSPAGGWTLAQDAADVPMQTIRSQKVRRSIGPTLGQRSPTVRNASAPNLDRGGDAFAGQVPNAVSE